MPPKRRVAKKPPTSRSGAGGGGGPRQKQKQIINLSIGKGASASSHEYRPPTIVQVQDHYAHEAMPTYTDRAATQAGDYLEMQRQNNAENLAERRQLMDRQFTHGLILTGVSAAVKALPMLREAYQNRAEFFDAGRRLYGRARGAVGDVQQMYRNFRGGRRLGGQPAAAPAAPAPLAAAAAAAGGGGAGPDLGGAAPGLARSNIQSGGSGNTAPFRTTGAGSIRPPRELRGQSFDTLTPQEQRFVGERGLADMTRPRRGGAADQRFDSSGYKSTGGYASDVDRSR